MECLFLIPPPATARSWSPTDVMISSNLTRVMVPRKSTSSCMPSHEMGAHAQGLTLLHFSDQPKHFLCMIWVGFGGVSGVVSVTKR